MQRKLSETTLHAWSIRRESREKEMEPILLEVPDRLRTARLLLRPPRTGDGAIVNQAVVESAAELAPWMPWAVPTPTIEDTEKWCRESAAKWLRRQEIHFLLFLRDSEICLGACGMHRIEWKVPMAEIGYWIRTSHAHNGYVTEAVAAVTSLAMQTLEISRVEIRCDEKNLRSAAVAERAGYTLEGVLRNDTRNHQGSLRSTCIYARVVNGAVRNAAAG